MVSPLVTDRPFATEAGTRRFAKRFADLHDGFREVALLQFSALGLGTYLGAADDATDAGYEASVIEAVRRGVNVFDTASNYRCQRSERALGRALHGLLASGELYRSEVVVASKAGFVPFDGEPPADAAAWMREATVGRGLCDADELVAGCHCLAPTYLRHTLAATLRNLQLATVDVYFLHNPETQLQVVDLPTLRERLRRAFQALEAAADAGLLRVYGLATWSGLRARPDERDFLPLELAMQCAEEVAGSRHRLRAIQLPISLALPEAVLCRNQTVRGRALTVVEAARELGLVVFGSGTLLQGKLARTTPHHVPPLPGTQTPAERALQFSRGIEGLTTALVGMARPDHVAQNAAVYRRPAPPQGWMQHAAQALEGACCG
jgi:aryl-alcohol dehydrogenase-like predicted oxidoreductase